MQAGFHTGFNLLLCMVTNFLTSSTLAIGKSGFDLMMAFTAGKKWRASTGDTGKASV